jgi:hypothetical protein
MEQGTSKKYCKHTIRGGLIIGLFILRPRLIIWIIKINIYNNCNNIDLYNINRRIVGILYYYIVQCRLIQLITGTWKIEDTGIINFILFLFFKLYIPL